VDLERALRSMLAQRAQGGAALEQACRAHASRFTWDATLAAIAGPLCKLLLARAATVPT
jgi:hypothetical protein